MADTSFDVLVEIGEMLKDCCKNALRSKVNKGESHGSRPVSSCIGDVFARVPVGKDKSHIGL